MVYYQLELVMMLCLIVDGTNDGVLLGIVDGVLLVDRHGTDDNDTVLLPEDGLGNGTGISVTSSVFSTDAANSEVSSSEISSSMLTIATGLGETMLGK